MGCDTDPGQTSPPTHIHPKLRPQPTLSVGVAQNFGEVWVWHKVSAKCGCGKGLGGELAPEGFDLGVEGVEIAGVVDHVGGEGEAFLT